MFFAPSPSLTGLRCHPLSLWHFANAPSDALKCSLLRFLSACSVNGRHWRRMLAIDTWQALNAFIEAVIAASCLVASVGECRRQRAKPSYQGCRGLAPCWGMGGAKPHGFELCWLFLRNEYKWGSLRHPTCIQYVEFEREKSAFCFLLSCMPLRTATMQLGVLFRETSKPHFCKAGLAKEKAFSASRFAPWTALLDYILTFQITENQ